jgi:hypothetical protein
LIPLPYADDLRNLEVEQDWGNVQPDQEQVLAARQMVQTLEVGMNLSLFFFSFLTFSKVMIHKSLRILLSKSIMLLFNPTLWESKRLEMKWKTISFLIKKDWKRLVM